MSHLAAKLYQPGCSTGRTGCLGESRYRSCYIEAPLLRFFTVVTEPDGAVLDGYLGRITGDCLEVGVPDDGPFRYVRVCPVADS